MELVRYHLKIYGQVQGVFFRKSAKIKADELGVVGWVKNRNDGSVEMMVQSEDSKAKKFMDWCKKGPPFAKVESVDVDLRKDLDNFSEFSII